MSEDRRRPLRPPHSYHDSVRRPRNSSPSQRNEDRGDRRCLSRNERYPERIPRLTSDEDHSQRHQPSTSTHMTPLDPPVSSRRTSPLPTSSSGPPNPYPSDCGIVVRRGLSRGRIGQKESASGLQNQDEGMNIVATRPSSNFNKEGEAGTPLQFLKSNYFKLLSKPNMHILQYRVDFMPEIEYIHLKLGLLKSHENIFGKYIFDGTLLYCSNQLPQPLELFSNLRRDNSVVGIKVRLVGEVDKEDGNYINVMNNIIRRCLKMLNLTMIKRNYYDSEAAIKLPSFEILPGYLTTIHQHEDGYLMGVEIIHKIMRYDTALSVMHQIRRNNPGNFLNLCKAELEGKIVMTRYNQKTYRIDELAHDVTPLSTFYYRKEDREITYKEYYQRRYQERISDTAQCLLISRPTRRDINRGDDKPIYLIPELCRMTGMTDEMRANFALTNELSTYTRISPGRRVESLMNFRRRLQDNEAIQRELSEWGLSFARDLINCRGRNIADNVKIESGDRSINIRDSNWTRNLDREPMAVSVTLKRWVVIVPIGEMVNKVKSFVKEMELCGRSQSFYLPEPTYVEMERDRIRDYTSYYRDHCTDKHFDIAMIVKRRGIDDVYKAIKKLACCELGLPVQVVTNSVINKQPRQIKAIATKVMVQIAAKLGAEPWRTSYYAPRDERWMVIGFDTFHDAKQNRAVGAFVGSINRTFTQYVSSVKRHENNEDISVSFRQHFTECVRAFYQRNRQFPTHIFLYRDGVGAGDIERVKEFELGAIKEACVDISGIVNINFNPRIAFIIVSKRITTRLLLSQRQGFENPPCGTVVDNTVTKVERYDFFLVSQKANTGTVSPTSYNIIQDDTNLSPDEHQQLAYALTHLYYNWTGNIRVPAPIQYAHKLAYLVGESDFQQLPLPSLSTLPYYL